MPELRFSLMQMASCCSDEQLGLNTKGAPPGQVGRLCWCRLSVVLRHKLQCENKFKAGKLSPAGVLDFSLVRPYSPLGSFGPLLPLGSALLLPWFGPKLFGSLGFLECLNVLLECARIFALCLQL